LEKVGGNLETKKKSAFEEEKSRVILKKREKSGKIV